MQSRIVIKVGGSLGSGALESLCVALAECQRAGAAAIVVHGGGPKITAALKEIGAELPFVGGQRVTPPELMPTVQRVLCDEVNTELALALEGAGQSVQPVTCRDEVLFATPLPGMGRTATVSGVNINPIHAAIEDGKIPLVAPVGMEQRTGLSCNVNADLAASAVAGAVGAERIVFFTDVDGIYANFETRELITDTTDAALARGLEEGLFEGGMRPKVTAVLESIRHGVKSAFVIHGGKPSAASWAVSKDLASSAPAQAQFIAEGSRGTCVTKANETVEQIPGGGVL